ncbi:MAG TPA: hypothetical protein PKN32_03180 [Bacteroidales bacterium]|nr:hypothetical protein [Bacteroidales bacterium]
MKFLIITICLGIIIFIGCKKDNNNLDHGVLIKGTLTNNKTKSTKSGLTLADADKIMVIYGQMFEVVEIDDESFALYAPPGSATALIFVTKKLEYIGHLSVGGMNMLPLVNLSDGENTVIDLSELTLDGDRVYPSNDPVGNEILISEEFIELLQELGAFYESLAENIDTDSDGKPDYFTDSHMMINTMFRVHAGACGVNETEAQLYNEINPDLQETFIEYFFNIRGGYGIIPEHINVAFNGPEGNPHTNINVGDNYSYYPNCKFGFQSTFDRSDGEPFETGVYNFSLDGTTFYKLHYYKIDVERFLVLARPRLITDNTGKVTNIMITYESSDNQNVEAPAFVTWLRVEIQKKDNGEDCIVIGENENDIISDYSNVIVPEEINIDNVEIVTISYADIVGNEYAIRWSHVE